MNLYFLRHTKAIEPGKGGISNDDDRPLSGKGEGKILKIAKGMKDMGLEFEAVLSSPSLRCVQTSGIVAAAFNLKTNVIISENLSSKGNPVQLLKEITSGHSHAKDLLLVGHESYLSGLISVLLVGDDSLDMVFKKGGLCKLGTEHLKYGKCASLCWFLTPAQLKLL